MDLKSSECLGLILLLLLIIFWCTSTGSIKKEGLTNNDSLTALKALQKQNLENLKKELSQHSTEVEIAAALKKLTLQFQYQDTLNKSINLLSGTGSVMDDLTK